MKVLVQRVNEAFVTIGLDKEVVGKIDSGFLIYICFEVNDTQEKLEQAIQKIINLRIFADDKERMNKNILQVDGQILSISQFTLSWDGKKGHRPSFDKSMDPNSAKIFYRNFNDSLEKKGIKIQKGRFGADMQVQSINDGPVTFLLEF